MEYRDIIRKQEKKLDKKLDRRDFIKAVITDALGNTTGAGSIWADRNTRRVWIQENGSASLSQVPCYRITPAIGLGVIVGYEPYSTIREVLATDREFYGPTNSTGTSYESPSNEDMLPGGRLQLWLDPRLLQPLAVYPTDNLNINVVEGSYPYNGVRKSFAGQINYDLSAYQPAGPNEHCLVGLYLDASNNLQVVAGATVSTAVTAPEPSWPSGSFLLAAVDLDDTQTSLSLADDIQDRRMAWSDEKTAPIDAQYLTLTTNSVLTQERVFTPSLPLSGSDGGAGNPYTLSVNAATESASGVAELATQAETNTGTDDARIVTPLKLANWTGAKSGWPVAGKAMINNVEYDTIQLAIDAMAAGDIIKIGQGTDAGGIVPDTAGSIVGLSPVETIITASANDSVAVNNSAGTDNLTLENLTISNTGAGTSVACIQSNKDGLRLDNLDIKKVSGTPTNSTGVSVYGGSGVGTYLLNCCVSVTTGTNKYGVYASTAACNIVIEGGEISAATADIYIGHASAVVELRGVKLLGGGINNASGGTVKGWYTNANGDKVIVGASDIKGVGSNFPDLGTTTAAEKWGAIYQAPTKDSFPDGDQRGLATRFIHPLGYDDHFRSGVIPTNYAWKANSGYFSGTPTINSYSYVGEYMLALSPVSGSAKHFLARAITNSAAAWQGQSLIARVKPANGGSVGIRLDNGNAATDQPYFEIYLTDNSNGTMTIHVDHKDTVGGGVTSATGATVPSKYLNLQIYCGSTYVVNGYVEGEDGVFPFIAGTGVLAWIPVAGSGGVFIVGNNNWQGVDLIKNTFG